MRSKRKGALLRSVSVNLAELRRVLEMKDSWFMGNMVTDRVGHWWGEGGSGIFGVLLKVRVDREVKARESGFEEATVEAALANDGAEGAWF